MRETFNEARVFGAFQSLSDVFSHHRSNKLKNMFRGGTCPAQPFGGQVRRLNEINKGESIVSSRARFLRRILDRLDDVLIAGAAAQISFEPVTNFIARRIGIAINDLTRRDDHSRRAKTTLQAVLLPKAFLN